MIATFHKLSNECSRLTTGLYSTSFSTAISILHKDLRAPIHNVYGFVRLADEIVDSFHEYDKAVLLAEFKEATYEAIERRISLNPILQSFQLTVNEFEIDHALIESFFRSMESDLHQQNYARQQYEEYIYGSAEVVGLMCLQIFCEKDPEKFAALKPAAQALGAAFQKVNFLRDLKADVEQLNRNYFPGADFGNFTTSMKTKIEEEIEEDFRAAYKGILQLPAKARFGVYVAYKYYYSLFKKIKRARPARLLHERIRIPNHSKFLILMRAGLRSQLNIL